MKSLPLFHRVAGQPVIVLGEGAAADAKRRLVERAGGVVVADMREGIERGARLAFVAIDQPEAAAAELRRAGVLVNVPDRPDLCDFTTPSVLDRDPVQVAVGTDGASAGLAKHLRLRLEALLPDSLGPLAQALAGGRDSLRARWPDPSERRAALDAALEQGGPLDPLADHPPSAVADWLRDGEEVERTGRVDLTIAADSPDDLTLRQLRLLGVADAILHDPDVPPAILDRARADAVRHLLPYEGPLPDGLTVVLRRER